jgi:hypothetical protein
MLVVSPLFPSTQLELVKALLQVFLLVHGVEHEVV